MDCLELNKKYAEKGLAIPVFVEQEIRADERAKVIDEFLKAYKEMPMSFSINECNRYMERVAEQLKEQNNE